MKKSPRACRKQDQIVRRVVKKSLTAPSPCSDAIRNELPAWVSVDDSLPVHKQRVLACYVGVYSARVVTFWRDAGGSGHFGYPRYAEEPEPATHWMPIPDEPNTRDVGPKPAAGSGTVRGFVGGTTQGEKR